MAGAKVNEAINDIRLIGNLANKASYDYEDDDAKEIFRALQKELDAAKSRFTGNGKTGDDSFRISQK